MIKSDEDTLNNQSEYLTENICNRTFHSLLRNEKRQDKNKSKKPFPNYLFPRNVHPVVKHLPELDCHIENYHGTNREPNATKKRRYIKDNILFDDSYTDFNQKLHLTKRQFAQTQNQRSSNGNSGIVNSNLAKNTTLSRRIKDNYTNNPIKWLNQTQINDYNNELQKKMEPHTKRVADYLSSKKIQKTFLNSKSEKTLNICLDKINSIPSSMYKTAIKQKQLEPNFSKKHLLTNRPKHQCLILGS